MAPDNKPQPEFTGDWHKDVGGVGNELQEVRAQFYSKKAQLKLSVEAEASLREKLKKGSGLVDKDRLTNADDFETPITKKWLYGALDTYFKDAVGVDDDGARKNEIFSSLYVIGTKINVDLLQKGWTIEIKKGLLYVKNGDNYVYSDVPLRLDEDAGDNDVQENVVENQTPPRQAAERAGRAKKAVEKQKTTGSSERNMYDEEVGELPETPKTGAQSKEPQKARAPKKHEKNMYDVDSEAAVMGEPGSKIVTKEPRRVSARDSGLFGLPAVGGLADSGNVRKFQGDSGLFPAGEVVTRTDTVDHGGTTAKPQPKKSDTPPAKPDKTADAAADKPLKMAAVDAIKLPQDVEPPKADQAPAPQKAEDEQEEKPTAQPVIEQEQQVEAKEVNENVIEQIKKILLVVYDNPEVTPLGNEKGPYDIDAVFEHRGIKVHDRIKLVLSNPKKGVEKGEIQFAYPLIGGIEIEHLPQSKKLKFASVKAFQGGFQTYLRAQNDALLHEILDNKQSVLNAWANNTNAQNAQTDPLMTPLDTIKELTGDADSDSRVLKIGARAVEGYSFNIDLLTDEKGQYTATVSNTLRFKGRVLELTADSIPSLVDQIAIIINEDESQAAKRVSNLKIPGMRPLLPSRKHKPAKESSTQEAAPPKEEVKTKEEDKTSEPTNDAQPQQPAPQSAAPSAQPPLPLADTAPTPEQKKEQLVQQAEKVQTHAERIKEDSKELPENIKKIFALFGKELLYAVTDDSAEKKAYEKEKVTYSLTREGEPKKAEVAVFKAADGQFHGSINFPSKVVGDGVEIALSGNPKDKKGVEKYQNEDLGVMIDEMVKDIRDYKDPEEPKTPEEKIQKAEEKKKIEAKHQLDQIGDLVGKYTRKGEEWPVVRVDFSGKSFEAVVRVSQDAKHYQYIVPNGSVEGEVIGDGDINVPSDPYEIRKDIYRSFAEQELLNATEKTEIEDAAKMAASRENYTVTVTQTPGKLHEPPSYEVSADVKSTDRVFGYNVGTMQLTPPAEKDGLWKAPMKMTILDHAEAEGEEESKYVLSVDVTCTRVGLAKTADAFIKTLVSNRIKNEELRKTNEKIQREKEAQQKAQQEKEAVEQAARELALHYEKRGITQAEDEAITKELEHPDLSIVGLTNKLLKLEKTPDLKGRRSIIVVGKMEPTEYPNTQKIKVRIPDRSALPVATFELDIYAQEGKGFAVLDKGDFSISFSKAEHVVSHIQSIFNSARYTTMVDGKSVSVDPEYFGAKRVEDSTDWSAPLHTDKKTEGVQGGAIDQEHIRKIKQKIETPTKKFFADNNLKAELEQKDDGTIEIKVDTPEGVAVAKGIQAVFTDSSNVESGVLKFNEPLATGLVAPGIITGANGSNVYRKIKEIKFANNADMLKKLDDIYVKTAARLAVDAVTSQTVVEGFIGSNPEYKNPVTDLNANPPYTTFEYKDFTVKVFLVPQYELKAAPSTYRYGYKAIVYKNGSELQQIWGHNMTSVPMDFISTEPIKYSNTMIPPRKKGGDEKVLSSMVSKSEPTIVNLFAHLESYLNSSQVSAVQNQEPGF